MSIDRFGAPPRPTAEDRERLIALMRVVDRLSMDRAFVLSLIRKNLSAGLPYHGSAHAVTVALRAAEDAGDVWLSESEIRALVLAGLCHDANYVVGDAEADNIARAVLFARNHISDEPVADRVASLIRATHFPHAHPGGEAEAIIQDADLLQCCEPDRDRFLAALEAEGVPASDDFPGVGMLNTDAGIKRFLAARP